MPTVITFGPAERDTSPWPDPSGYDPERCRHVIHRELSHLDPPPEHVVLNLAGWVGPPHPWIAHDLAGFLRHGTKLTINGRRDYPQLWRAALRAAWLHQAEQARQEGSPARGN